MKSTAAYHLLHPFTRTSKVPWSDARNPCHHDQTILHKSPTSPEESQHRNMTLYIYMLHIHYHHYHPSIKHASLCFYSVLMKWSPFHDLFQQEIWAAGPTTPGVSSAPHAAAHVKPSASPWGPWRCRWQASGNHVALFLEDAAKEWAYIYIILKTYDVLYNVSESYANVTCI